MFLLLLAAMQDLPARLDREVARPASDDVSVREKALDAIVAEGEPALPPLRLRLAKAGDPESVARLERAIDLIDAEIVRERFGLRGRDVVRLKFGPVEPGPRPRRGLHPPLAAAVEFYKKLKIE